MSITLFATIHGSRFANASAFTIDIRTHNAYCYVVMNQTLQWKKITGFTIVELLIVIVVIGVLAAIVVVAYNGITRTAQQSAITAELRQWAKLFQLYKAQNGNYPAPSATPATGGGPGSSVLDRYCLGTGFPQSGGSGYCYVVVSNTPYSVAESTGTSLISQLSTVGTPPSNTDKYIFGSVAGPTLRYVSASEIRLGSTYSPGTTCPPGMVLEYSDSSRVDCYISLN